jgi:uncharacterized protein
MTRLCPICRKSTDSQVHADFPFCSQRCRLHDLGNWASEKYVISEPAYDESMFERLERDLAAEASPSESSVETPEVDDE